ncbi:MAG: hypothetical protein M3H12_15040, partial [Chromatiales bacterium]
MLKKVLVVLFFMITPAIFSIALGRPADTSRDETNTPSAKKRPDLGPDSIKYIGDPDLYAEELSRLAGIINKTIKAFSTSGSIEETHRLLALLNKTTALLEALEKTGPEMA